MIISDVLLYTNEKHFTSSLWISALLGGRRSDSRESVTIKHHNINIENSVYVCILVCLCVHVCMYMCAYVFVHAYM